MDALLRVRMDCLSHCSRGQPAFPVASTPMPAPTHAVVPGLRIFEVLSKSCNTGPRFPRKPQFGGTASLIHSVPRTPARQMVFRLLLCPCHEDSEVQGTSQTGGFRITKPTAVAHNGGYERLLFGPQVLGL